LTEYKVNEEIKYEEVILIDDEKNNLGNVKIQVAIDLAFEKNLDLVLFSENPPVCKIMNYKKFIFDQKKAIKKQRKSSKEEVLKEIKIGYFISDNDLKTKINKIKDLVKSGCKVKLSSRIVKRNSSFSENIVNSFERVYTETKSDKMPEDFIKTSENIIYGIISP
jgi:translation initiation factor IF-3